MPSIPSVVRHSDFRAAIKPLLDLIGVTDEDVFCDVHITQSESPRSLFQIQVTLAADVDGAAERGTPVIVRASGDEREFDERGYLVTVEVV